MTNRPFCGALLVIAAATCLCAQDPLAELPNNYHLIYQNECVRVVDVNYIAHEKLPVHNHSDKPTVYVYLTDSGPVRFSHLEAHPFSLLRPAEKAGTFRVSPGRLEKHEVENVGDIPTEFLRVELKQVPLGFQGSSYRSVKPFDLSHSSVSNEFPGPFIKIERIIAARDQAIQITQSGAPALLIAFSSTALQIKGQSHSQMLKRGDVLWMNAHSSFRVASVSKGVAGHLLRITFLDKT